MKAFVLTDIRQMELADIPTPEIIKDTDVLVKMKATGVCGSDIHYYKNGRIGSQVIKYPFVIGHEGSGIVEKIGKYVKGVKPGDRIAIEPAMPCFTCDQCMAGRHNTCRNLKFLGCPGQAEGCLTEYIVIPETSCIKMTEEMSFEEGAISEPLSIGLYSIERAGNLMGKSIGILGYGPIGMSVHLSSLIQKPEKVIITDKIKDRLEKAEKTGASLTINAKDDDRIKQITKEASEGLDIIFECCGQQEAIEDAIDLIKPGGSIVIVGIPEFDTWSLSADKIRRKEITIINIRRQNNCADTAVNLIGNKTIDVKSMTTHRFNFFETKKAFELVENYNDGVMKAIIEFD